jgi:hypothetical protein
MARQVVDLGASGLTVHAAAAGSRAAKLGPARLSIRLASNSQKGSSCSDL